MTISFSIDGDPVPKARPRLGRGGHVFTPKKTHLYEQKVKELAKRAMGELDPLDCPVKVEMTAFFAIPKSWSKKKKVAADLGPHSHKPDLDNVVKSVVDGMNGVVFIDDALVSQVTAKKIYSQIPHVEVRIEEIGGKDGAYTTKP